METQIQLHNPDLDTPVLHTGQIFNVVSINAGGIRTKFKRDLLGKLLLDLQAGAGLITEARHGKLYHTKCRNGVLLQPRLISAYDELLSPSGERETWRGGPSVPASNGTFDQTQTGTPSRPLPRAPQLGYKTTRRGAKSAAPAIPSPLRLLCKSLGLKTDGGEEVYAIHETDNEVTMSYPRSGGAKRPRTPPRPPFPHICILSRNKHLRKTPPPPTFIPFRQTTSPPPP